MGGAFFTQQRIRRERPTFMDRTAGMRFDFRRRFNRLILMYTHLSPASAIGGEEACREISCFVTRVFPSRTHGGRR